MLKRRYRLVVHVIRDIFALVVASASHKGTRGEGSICAVYFRFYFRRGDSQEEDKACYDMDRPVATLSPKKAACAFAVLARSAASFPWGCVDVTYCCRAMLRYVTFLTSYTRGCFLRSCIMVEASVKRCC